MIPSELFLQENWSPVMASGDLAAAKAWLLHDLKAAHEGLFYVMQANPNNKEEKMYEDINREDFVQWPSSNLQFLHSFLTDLPGLIFEAVRMNPHVRINVIDSDFLNISKPYATAMRLNSDGDPLRFGILCFLAAVGLFMLIFSHMCQRAYLINELHPQSLGCLVENVVTGLTG